MRSSIGAYSEAYLGFNDMFNDGAGYNEPQVGTEADTIGGKTRYLAWYSPQSRALLCRTAIPAATSGR